MRCKGIFCGIAMVAIYMAAVSGSATAQTAVTETGGAANSVPVFTSATAVTKSAITQSGSNIGIGTTSPSHTFDVAGHSIIGDGVDSDAYYFTNGGTIYAGSPDSPILTLSGGGGTYAQFLLKNGDGTGNNWPNIGMANRNSAGNHILGTQIQTAMTNPAAGSETQALLFSTQNGGTALTEKMRIAGNGNVGIGTTAPTQTLSVNGSISATSGTGSGGLYFRTVGGSQNTAVSPILLTEGVLSGNGSAATPWGLNLVSAPWSWGEDPMTYHAGIHLFRIAGADTAETEVVQINSGGLSIDSGFSLNFADGTKQSTAWTGVLCGGDYAESVDVSGGLTKNEPGDLLVIDPDTPDKFVKSMEPYSSAIAGVYSTKPGVVGRHQTTPKSEDEVPMAVVGIVPVKVSAENGPIRPRDLLVSASTPGYAMKGTDRSRMLGAIVGKAMGSLDSGTGVINVLVTLQ